MSQEIACASPSCLPPWVSLQSSALASWAPPVPRRAARFRAAPLATLVRLVILVTLEWLVPAAGAGIPILVWRNPDELRSALVTLGFALL